MSLPLSKAQAIARALLVTPLGAPDGDVRAYAERWFGPECVRVEVTGYAATEYDDERTMDHGNREAVGYTQDGRRLAEMFVENDGDTTDSYWEALAQFEIDLAEGEAGENDRPDGTDDTWGMDFHEAREAQIIELADLEEGLHYWGDPVQDPYAAERALLTKIDAAV